LFSGVVEDLDADAVELGEGVADLRERPEVEEVAERRRLEEYRLLHLHVASTRPRSEPTNSAS